MASRDFFLKWLLAGLLLTSAFTCVLLGSIRLVQGGYPFASDACLRWIEQQNVYHGRDPATVSTDAVPPYIQPGYIHDGVLATSCYPPWAFTTQALFVPPVPWAAERWIMLGWSLAALAFLGFWTRAQFLPYGKDLAWLGVLLPAALWSVAYCLSNGQYAIVLMALIAGSFLLADRGRDGWAGLLIGLALLKPTLTAPFLLIFLYQGRWKLLGTAALLNLAATLVTWHLTGVDPLTLLRESAAHVRAFPVHSQNVISTLVLAVAGEPNPALDFAVMLALGAIGAAVLFAADRRGCRLTTRAGIAAVLALSWTYRKEYDVVLILFLVVALTQTALEARRVSVWLALAFLDSILFLPVRLEDHNRAALQAAELLSWIIAIAVCWREGVSGQGAARAQADQHPSMVSG